jgi:hypothetical protein
MVENIEVLVAEQVQLRAGGEEVIAGLRDLQPVFAAEQKF